MIRSPVFLAQPDAGLVPSLVRTVVGTASPDPGAHPRIRVFVCRKLEHVNRSVDLPRG